MFFGEEENLFGSHQRGRQTCCDVIGDTLSLSRYMNGNHSRVLATGSTIDIVDTPSTKQRNFDEGFFFWFIYRRQGINTSITVFSFERD